MTNRIKPYLLIMPTAILLIFVLGVGVINCLVQSLGYFPQIGMKNITIDYYKEILGDTSFLKSLLFSLKISLISSLICVILGVFLAYLLSKERYSKTRNALLNLPVIVPHIVVVIIMFAIFSKTGIISRILHSLNIIEDSSEFINLVMDKEGVGIILVYLWKGTPFVAITTYNILKNINDKLELVAKNLGASKFQCFLYVTIPLSMPSILSSFIILFAFYFGSYEVPFLIGPSSPKMIAVSAYTNYISSDLSKRAAAMAINIIISSISFIMMIIYNNLFKKIYKYKL